MKKTLFGVAVAMVFAASPVSAEDASGYWKGRIADSLNLFLQFSKAPEGRWEGTLTVPQQEYASKLDQLVVTDDQISFRLNGLDAGFSARWNAQGKMWVGTWTQQGRSASLNLERTDAAAQKPKRPQEDAIAARQPDYTSREVAFTNAPARITLSGTFSVPRGRQGGRDAG